MRLIAAANVASLLLARGVGRRQELAVRTVLGASTARVIQPALLESVLIAFTGALLGLGLAWTGVRAIGTVAAVRLPQLTGLALDWNVAAIALALAAAVAVACGAAPAWQAAGSDPQEALRSGGRSETGGSQHRLLGGWSPRMSYAVARRTMELGIRSALGSTPGRTVGLVMRQGMALDALTWSVVTLVLAGAGAVAILIPARRASWVDPLVAMRTE